MIASHAAVDINCITGSTDTAGFSRKILHAKTLLSGSRCEFLAVVQSGEDLECFCLRIKTHIIYLS